MCICVSLLGVRKSIHPTKIELEGTGMIIHLDQGALATAMLSSLASVKNRVVCFVGTGLARSS